MYTVTQTPFPSELLHRIRIEQTIMKDKMPSPLSKDMTISDTTKTMQAFITSKNLVIFFFLFNNLCKLVILRNLLESLLKDGKSNTDGILCPASRLKFGQQCPESERSLKYWA